MEHILRQSCILICHMSGRAAVIKLPVQTISLFNPVWIFNFSMYFPLLSTLCQHCHWNWQLLTGKYHPTWAIKNHSYATNYRRVCCRPWPPSGPTLDSEIAGWFCMVSPKTLSSSATEMVTPPGDQQFRGSFIHCSVVKLLNSLWLNRDLTINQLNHHHKLIAINYSRVSVHPLWTDG